METRVVLWLYSSLRNALSLTRRVAGKSYW